MKVIKVAPMEEVVDLRRKIYIMNAEIFLKTRNEHAILVGQVLEKITDNASAEMKEKIASIRRKGAYYSARGEQNFVRYNKNIVELNNALRQILVTLQTEN
ncbi:unnamed protein product [Caenorhabditis brenneri]